MTLKLAFLSLAVPCFCLASTRGASLQFACLDEIVSSAAKGQEARSNALYLLKQVAPGRAAEITPEAQAQAGISAGELQKEWFAVPDVRAYAFEKIGQVAGPEAIEFLEQVKREDFGPDTVSRVWPAAQVAIRIARLRAITDHQAQVQFIEQTLASQLPDGRGRIAWWAINELCDRGVLTSMANIQYTIKRNLSDKRAEEEVQFCEARIRAVNRYPDRAKALGAVLSLDARPDDERLLRWALDKLESMHSTNADAELKRFHIELSELPRGSALYQRWYGFKRELDTKVARQKAK